MHFFRYGDDEVNSCLELFMEEKVVMAVSGFLELHDFPSHNFNDLNKKGQSWKEISCTRYFGELVL